MQQELRIVWPIYEKDQAKQFKQLIFKKLESLEKETQFLPVHQPIRLSLLNTCSGERFYHLLWFLSSLVLRKGLSEHTFSFFVPSIAWTLLDARSVNDSLLTAIKQQIEIQANRFLHNAATFTEIKRRWKQFDSQLHEEHVSTKQQLVSRNLVTS